MRELVKRIAEKVPHSVGRHFSGVPMKLRLGGGYTRFQHAASSVRSVDEMAEDAFQAVRALVLHASSNVEFYRSFYRDRSFDPRELTRFDNLACIPVVTKGDLQEFSLSQRSSAVAGLKRSNTGGTSGRPLDFFLEKGAYGREWAHMHLIWRTLGYSPRDEKLTVRGRNIGPGFYRYSFNQNEFLINAYSPLRENIRACRRVVEGSRIKWIHGYPSSVVSFLRELEKADLGLFETLLSKIKGVFLGSEFPAPHYRDYLQSYCGLPTISWYGHSEMAVLAPERVPGSGVYFPYQSYGFAEAVGREGAFSLVGTSFHNFATPFIRYDTGDLIEPTCREGLLESFVVSDGRTGESVVDLNGRAISLTALIFGRHHRAFDHAQHVQVKQVRPGSIELLITSASGTRDWSKLFDLSNAFFDVTYRQIQAPITTALGKVKLLVKN